MTAQHSYSIARRWLAALAVALTFAVGLGLAGGATRPAAADSSQWKISQPHWSGQSNGWRRHNQGRQQWHHKQWRHNQWRQRHSFNNGFNGCYGNCGRPVIVFNGGGVIVASPGFVIVKPGFIVRQPGFAVRRQPNLIFERPAFASKQKAFIKRHPSLQLGQPMRHKPKFQHQGPRVIMPGMN